jgi:hypothetical protein
MVISPRRAVGVVLVFLPTLSLLVAAYVQRPPLPADFEGTRLARLPQDSALAHVYRWAQSETSPNAVFIVDPRQRVAMCGNISEFPAMTARVIFTEERQHYMVEPYPDSEMRFIMAVRLVSGDEPGDWDRAYLSRLGRPVYIVSHQSSDSTLMGRLQTLYGPPVFHVGTIAVFKWPIMGTKTSISSGKVSPNG